MCARFTLRVPAQRVLEIFELAPQSAGPLELPPRYNIAPTQVIPVVRASPESRERELALTRWGLIPSWSKEPGRDPLVNARSETAAEKPSFRASFKSRRCLIPASGFYEWQKVGAGKQPYHIGLRDDDLLAFAGLWDRWHGADGSVIDSCAILTTEPNELLAPIHNRMPVILDREQFDVWLDPTMKDPLLLNALLRPYPADAMLAYPISTAVNNPRFDDARCLAPLEGSA